MQAHAENTTVRARNISALINSCPPCQNRKVPKLSDINYKQWRTSGKVWRWWPSIGAGWNTYKHCLLHGRESRQYGLCHRLEARQKNGLCHRLESRQNGLCHRLEFIENHLFRGLHDCPNNPWSGLDDQECAHFLYPAATLCTIFT